MVLHKTFLLFVLILTAVSQAKAAAPPEPSPVKVTYQCEGNVKVYFKRVTLGLNTSTQSASFKAIGYPKIENTELAILDAAGHVEYLIRPALAECGCLSDDQIFVTQFKASGPQHRTVAQGPVQFELDDHSGKLSCQITLEGLNTN